MDAAIWNKLSLLEETRTPHVLVVLTEVRGSAPQDVGAKMLVTREGAVLGTVGGGKVEAAAIRHAAGLLGVNESTRVETVEWNLQRDIGMTCGGAVVFLFHARNFSSWSIAIFGAGHVVQALAPLLVPLEARVLIFDTRAEWIARLPKRPGFEAHCCPDPAAEVDALPAGSFLLAITQGHATDVPILACAFRRGVFPFIGCIGSEVKAARLRRDLEALGIPGGTVRALRCPLGLPIGTNAPHEIAISIAAQLLEVRDAVAGR